MTAHVRHRVHRYKDLTSPVLEPLFFCLFTSRSSGAASSWNISRAGMRSSSSSAGRDISSAKSRSVNAHCPKVMKVTKLDFD